MSVPPRTARPAFCTSWNVIADDLQVVGLVLDPRSDHVLEPGPLPRVDADGRDIVDLIALHQDVGRAPLEHQAIVAGVVDLAAEDVAVLHGDVIEREPEG